MDVVPALEITTVLGCSIQCKYCPQDVLMESGLSRSTRQLRLSDFILLCDKLPRPFRLHFTGFSEPFHNRECGTMLRYASAKGFQLKLSTTLTGLQPNDFEIFEKQLCSRVMLHLPSNEPLMNIRITDEYLAAVGRILPMLQSTDLVMTFGDRFHASVEELLSRHIGTVETRVITPTSDHWYTRAGNNLLFKRPPDLKGARSIRCMKDRLFQNVVLPDGTVVLCCMDWSGQHTLGNIFDQSYDELMSGPEFAKVVLGLRNPESGTLCWTCEYGLISDNG